MTKKTNPESANSLENLPGLGPVSLGALNREGVTNGLELVFRGATFLKDVTGMDREKAGHILQVLRGNLEKAGLLNEEEMTATQALPKRILVQKLAFGCYSIDMMLGGGIECGAITEIYGENGSGKTQASHTLTVQALRPVSDGGLNAEQVLYIDTENTFRPERILTILAGKGLIVDAPVSLQKKKLEGNLTPAEIEELKKIEALQVEEAKKYMDRIVKWRAINAYDLHEKIERLFSEIPKRKIKFVVVDSGTQLFREEYLGRGNISAKFQLMNQTINKLKHVAEVYNIPVLFVNQIYHKPDEMFGADADIPYGGNIIGHAIPYRLKFWKSGRRHAVRIVKSPHQDNLDCKFEIARSGLVDPQ